MNLNVSRCTSTGFCVPPDKLFDRQPVSGVNHLMHRQKVTSGCFTMMNQSQEFTSSFSVVNPMSSSIGYNSNHQTVTPTKQSVIGSKFIISFYVFPIPLR